MLKEEFDLLNFKAGTKKFAEEVNDEEDEVSKEGVLIEAIVTPLDRPKLTVFPNFQERFQALVIKELINETMKEQLLGRPYRDDQVNKWVIQIANAVKVRVTELNMKRYKVIVNVVLLEMKGAGAKSAMRCLWDQNTDNYVSDEFRSDTIMCHTTVFGVYLY